MAKLRIGRKVKFQVNPIDLLKAREEQGWTQEQLSQNIPSLGKQQTISNIESQLLPHGIDRKVLERLMEIFEIEFYDV